MKNNKRIFLVYKATKNMDFNDLEALSIAAEKIASHIEIEDDEVFEVLSDSESDSDYDFHSKH